MTGWGFNDDDFGGSSDLAGAGLAAPPGAPAPARAVGGCVKYRVGGNEGLAAV